jgi:hypothetical protein
MFEEGKVGGNGKVALTEMDKDGDLKNGVLIEMNKFNLIVTEVADEITGREYESSLEKGSHHHNFFGMRGGNFFILG